MLLDDWLTIVEKGNFSWPLTELRLKRTDGIVFEGSGHLTWDTERGVRLQANTAGAEHLRGSFGEVPFRIGQVIPATAYLRLEARTQDGWDVHVERISSGWGHHLHWASEHVVWDIKEGVSSIVEFSRTNDSPNEVRTSMLLETVHLSLWPRQSQFIDENPRLGRRSSRADWLEVDTSIGKLIARQRQNELAEAHLVLGDSSEINHFDAANAVGLAFGFLLGHTVNVIGRESHLSNETRRVLNPIAPTIKRACSPPLGYGPDLFEFVEPLLCKAMDFFVSKRGREIGNSLYACWDSADNNFTIRALVRCAVLEELIRIISDKSETISGIDDGEIERLLGVLKDGDYGKRFIERLKGFLGQLKYPSAKNVLKEWVEDGVLEIGHDDIKAWGDLRNATAHGKLIVTGEEREKLQQYVDASHRVENLINKLVLQSMGYEGKFFDFARGISRTFPGMHHASI